MTGFSLANPKMHGERDRARQTLERQPANRPAPGTAAVTDKGLSAQGTEEFFAGDIPRLTLIRPAPPRPAKTVSATQITRRSASRPSGT